MIDPVILVPYVVACLLFSIIPGPSVAVVVANSLAGGTRAGLLTILGTEISMLTMVLIVALGLQTVMALVSDAFVVIKLVGAAYLIWIGWKMLTSSGEVVVKAGKRRSGVNYVIQGGLVNWTNPKTLLFLGAFLPQFIDSGRDAFPQIMILGLIVMAVATLTDSIYAIAAGRARTMFTAARVRLMSRISGGVIMAGGGWLALQERA